MVYNLIDGLLQAGEAVSLFLTTETSLDPSLLDRVRSWLAIGELTLHPVGGRGNRFVRETFILPRVIRQADIGCLIFPNYFTPPTVRDLRTLTAILDVQYLHFPQYFSLAKRVWLQITHRLTLRTADVVVVISEFVRDDVLDRYGVQFAGKIRTIPVAISWGRFARPRLPNALSERRPFILTVASHYDHKNLDTLLRAFALIRDKFEHDLVLVGQKRGRLLGVRRNAGVDLETLASELGIANRVLLLGHVTDAEAAYCYAHAALFVLPSLFEGFGMPAVEALGLGLPTLTTRCGSLPETTLGLAQYIDNPRDPQELAAAMYAILEAPERYRPHEADVQRIRAYYAPQRIARLYLGALK